MSLRDDWAYSEGDPGIKLFTSALQAFQFDIPDGAKILELGCCESDWAARLKRTRPNCYITGIDVRPCPNYGGDHIIQGDASTYPFERNSFDWIVALGSVEHFGLGWYEYGDPQNPQADIQAIQNAWYALKPGGQIYLDVPYTPATMFQTGHWRCYDDLGIANLTAGFTLKQWGWARNEHETELQLERPDAPYSPFWFIAIWGEKQAA